MGLWSYYFFVKFFLHWFQYLNLDGPLNLLFALWLSTPVREKFDRTPGLRRFFFGVNIVLAALLLWRDSWFPPLLETLAFVQQQGLPSADYLINLASRMVKGEFLWYLVALYIITAIASKFLRMTTFAVLGIVAIMGAQYLQRPDRAGLDAVYDSFRDTEDIRAIHLSREIDPEDMVVAGPDADVGQVEGENFDIVILHICSLAWADMNLVLPEGNTFFRQFDFLFTNFNTVTAYSGPAMVRLLRAPCGQPSHNDLYETTRPECYLLPSLEHVGYTVDIALNHDGHYGEFREQLSTLGGSDKEPVSLDGLVSPLKMFDGTPIYGDSSVLDRWLKRRSEEGDEPPHLLYYNTVTLHDGVMKSGGKGNVGDVNDQYRALLLSLFADLSHFLEQLEAVGRNTVVIFVPEHGRALTGSALQPAGIREVPTPDITLAPVGVRFVGKRFIDSPFAQVIVESPTSFYALAFMIDSFLKKNPFVYEGYDSQRFVDNIPITDFVSENQGVKIINSNGAFYYMGKRKNWTELPVK